MLLGMIMLMQLSINCRLCHCWFLFSSTVGGDAVITCRDTRRDWLQQLYLM